MARPRGATTALANLDTPADQGPAHVLIVGVSTRAPAESAARAGYAVTALDAFADLDQHPAVRARALDNYSTQTAAAASRQIDSDAVVYVAGFENDPDAVEVISRGRVLWGNPPSVLRRVRDPVQARRAFLDSSVAAPDVRQKRPTRGPATRTPWMVKPRGRGGGQGVRRWCGEPVTRDRYLQRFVAGWPGAVVFASAGGRAVVLGITRQLIGAGAFGASGYQYCGSVLSMQDPNLVHAACRLAEAATGAFGLVGVNCVDFVVSGDVPFPVEVNPRWSASMELIERWSGLSLFAAHATACTHGRLPDFDILAGKVFGGGAVGKAVVFARHDLVVGDAGVWLADPGTGGFPRLRDVPPKGQHIRAGRPVATVFAEGDSLPDCFRGLVSRADEVYAQLQVTERIPRR